MQTDRDSVTTSDTERADQQCIFNLVFIVDFTDGSACESERGSDDARSDGKWRDVRSVDVSYISPDGGSDGGSSGVGHKRSYKWSDKRAFKRSDTQQCGDVCRSHCIFISELVSLVDIDDGCAHLVSHGHCNIIAC